MELLTHHNVSLIAKFNRGTFSFMAPDHWAAGDGDTEGRNTANWQVMLIEVSNEAGRRPPEEGGHKRIGAEQLIIRRGASLGCSAIPTQGSGLHKRGNCIQHKTTGGIPGGEKGRKRNRPAKANPDRPRRSINSGGVTTLG